MPRKSRIRPGGPFQPLGSCESVSEIEALIYRCMCVVWDGNDDGRARVVADMARMLLWSKFTTKGLEVKGMNMDGSAPEVKVTLNDYASEHERLKSLEEENAALREQNALLMQGRERPRPPRPQMN